MTSLASASRARCLAMACRVIGSRVARSVAVAGPPPASAARMLRRVGSARAANTSWATASGSGLSIEVRDQLAQLVGPAARVAREGLVVQSRVRHLGEPGLDHRQRGAAAGRLEREL